MLPLRRVLPYLLLSLALAASAAACGGGAGKGKQSGFGEGRGFGIAPQTPQAAVDATAQADELRSANWDVAIDMAPGTATVTERPDSWSATNTDRATPAAGQFTFMVMRAEAVKQADPKLLATLLRDEELSRGVKATEVADTEFLGLPGAMFLSGGDGVTNVTVLTVSESCVYVLNVTHSGDQEAIERYFGNLVRQIKTYRGGPVNAPACR